MAVILLELRITFLHCFSVTRGSSYKWSDGIIKRKCEYVCLFRVEIVSFWEQMPVLTSNLM